MSKTDRYINTDRTRESETAKDQERETMRELRADRERKRERCHEIIDFQTGSVFLFQSLCLFFVELISETICYCNKAPGLQIHRYYNEKVNVGPVSLVEDEIPTQKISFTWTFGNWIL